tara:strand:- start:78 stop:761 length:684 start_codon:yes stop_codon:yes gene_type:complete
MKRLSILIVFFLIINIEVFAHVNHYKKYNYLEYELFRNNKLIGYHKYNFERNKDFLKVKSYVEFNISKLGVNLYRYEAISEESYKNDKFFDFSSKTNQNKKKKYVNIKFDEINSKLIVDGSSYKGDADKDFIVGTWWNHEIIKAKAQISAISGRIIHQKVTFLGKERLNINGKTYEALRFNFSSSDKNLPEKKKLNTDIWYDEKTNLWLKASFDKTGHWEYRLKKYN